MSLSPFQKIGRPEIIRSLSSVTPNTHSNRGNTWRRSNSWTPIDNSQKDASKEDIRPRRLPSPFLLGDFSFRQQLLIDHYVRHLFIGQVFNSAMNATVIPSVDWVRALIASTPALQHSVCALAAVTFPSHPKPQKKEVLAHLGMALLFLRKSIANHDTSEGILLAILGLIDFEVLPDCD